MKGRFESARWLFGSGRRRSVWLRRSLARSDAWMPSFAQLASIDRRELADQTREAKNFRFEKLRATVARCLVAVRDVSALRRGTLTIGLAVPYGTRARSSFSGGPVPACARGRTPRRRARAMSVRDRARRRSSARHLLGRLDRRAGTLLDSAARDRVSSRALRLSRSRRSHLESTPEWRE
jgi:hypothetical protein